MQVSVELGDFFSSFDPLIICAKFEINKKWLTVCDHYITWFDVIMNFARVMYQLQNAYDVNHEFEYGVNLRGSL